MQTDVLHAGMSFFMLNMKGKQTMSKMKATDKQAMEILKKLDELIDFSVDLETNLDESESIEEVCFSAWKIRSMNSAVRSR